MNDIADPGNAGTSPPAAPRTTVQHSGNPALILLIVLLPPLIYYMWICVRFYDGALVLPTSAAALRDLVSHVPGPTAPALLFYACWIGLQALLQIYLPGRMREGAPLEDGTRLQYRMNGWLSFWLTLGLAGLLVGSGLVSGTFLADQLGAVMTVANVFTFGLCLYLYRLGRRQEPAGGTGQALHDYIMGAALNPRDGAFDWKIFCEARPGLILWVLIDFSLLLKQRAALGAVSMPMLLVCLFQLLYVADYFYNEEAILSTWDIRHERFGWMLCWGCLVWVPFTYTLQAEYLSHHGNDLPAWAILGLIALNMAGYYLFRSSNLQKHRFRDDPNTLIWGQPATYLRTARGSLLLTSGWWGVGRHMNYTGDLMMGLAWCLPCGFGRILPYFYIIYFTILLIHREHRDNQSCKARYGADWDAYCQKVRWRMLPGIY